MQTFNEKLVGDSGQPKVSDLLWFVRGLVKVGDVAGAKGTLARFDALQSANRIRRDDRRASALASLAQVQVMVGNIPEAKEAVAAYVQTKLQSKRGGAI